MSVTETTVRVGRVEEFAENSITPIMVAGSELVLVRQGGKFYALPDRCTHARFPLHDGELEGGAIKCAHHGARFDLETGQPTLPAVKKIRLYTTKIEAGEVFVTLQEN